MGNAAASSEDITMDRLTRIGAAAFVVVGGLVHLQLWRSGYKEIPYIGSWFIANVVVSAALALVVVAVNKAWVNLAGILFSASSLVALVMSRTTGLFGFTERAWTDQALRATTAELGAIVAFAAILVATRRRIPAFVPVRTGSTARSSR
ncbi:MAG: hypothetical protein CYG61_09725 [Actinobacteria bacterium]|nr:MAG: hypothetical protein CYG61_09725 [Actinomycetota bacterium]